MPKVMLYFEAGSTTSERYRDQHFAFRICRIVALVMDTPQHKVGINDIDYIPNELSSFGRTSVRVWIEIEAIGYPDRKRKLKRKKVMSDLKKNLLFVLNVPQLKLTDPLVWIKWTTGPHF